MFKSKALKFMDIKDRLNLTHISKPEVPHVVLSQDPMENTGNESALFDENEIVLGIITEKINSGANIVYVCPQNCSKKTVALLLKNYVRRNIAVNFPASKQEYKPGNINFIPEASGEDLKDITEAAMTGISSFVAGINLNSYDKFAEKTETLIALNTGLSEKYIKILFREFSPIFIYIEEENGVFVVKSIDKNAVKNSLIETKNLYSYFTGVKQANENGVKENSLLPDFKSILEETVANKTNSVANKTNSVENELIVNNPALKNSTDKYAVAEANTKPMPAPAQTAAKEASKSENIVISDFMENSKEAVKQYEKEAVKSIEKEIEEEEKAAAEEKEQLEPGIIPSVKNILEDESDGGEKEILTEVKNENEVSGDNVSFGEVKAPSEEAPEENININIPAQATPVNKYKVLRDKIKSKKEKEASV